MKTLLYVGLEPPERSDVRVIHCPLIEIIPRARDCPHIAHALSHLPTVTHVIATSKTAVRCLFQLLTLDKIKEKTFLSVGKVTTQCLNSFGAHNVITAQEESQEGIIELIKNEQLISQTFFWGHSSLSRPLLADFLGSRMIECILYDTIYKTPEQAISLDEIDEIFFSSPSTVKAFCAHFGRIPKDKQLHVQGTQTAFALQQVSGQNCLRELS